MTEAVQAMVCTCCDGSIVVVGALAHCILLHSSDECSQIQELYEFKLSEHTVEITKKICCAKGKVAVDHGTVNRWFIKFYSSCKKLKYQARSGRSKMMDSEVALQAIKVNPMSST